MWVPIEETLQDVGPWPKMYQSNKNHHFPQGAGQFGCHAMLWSEFLTISRISGLNSNFVKLSLVAILDGLKITFACIITFSC